MFPDGATLMTENVTTSDLKTSPELNRLLRHASERKGLIEANAVWLHPVIKQLFSEETSEQSRPFPVAANQLIASLSDRIAVFDAITHCGLELREIFQRIVRRGKSELGDLSSALSRFQKFYNVQTQYPLFALPPQMLQQWFQSCGMKPVESAVVSKGLSTALLVETSQFPLDPKTSRDLLTAALFQDIGLLHLEKVSIPVSSLMEQELHAQIGAAIMPIRKGRLNQLVRFHEFDRKQGQPVEMPNYLFRSAVMTALPVAIRFQELLSLHLTSEPYEVLDQVASAFDQLEEQCSQERHEMTMVRIMERGISRVLEPLIAKRLIHVEQWHEPVTTPAEEPTETPQPIQRHDGPHELVTGNSNRDTETTEQVEFSSKRPTRKKRRLSVGPRIR